MNDPFSVVKGYANPGGVIGRLTRTTRAKDLKVQQAIAAANKKRWEKK